MPLNIKMNGNYIIRKESQHLPSGLLWGLLSGNSLGSSFALKGQKGSLQRSPGPATEGESEGLRSGESGLPWDNAPKHLVI